MRIGIDLRRMSTGTSCTLALTFLVAAATCRVETAAGSPSSPRTTSGDDSEPEPRPEGSSAATAHREGLASYRNGQLADALEHLRRARDRDPHWAEAARMLGEVAYVAGRLPEARLAYEAAFQLDPDLGSGRDYSYYADALATDGDLKGALAVLETALERFPYEPGLHAKRGQLLESDDQLAQAYDHFLLELALQGVEGPFATPALEASERVVASVTTQTNHAARPVLLMISTGLASLESGKMHHAIHELQHADRLGQDLVVPRLMLADALVRAGRAHEARSMLELLLRERPDFVPALHSLAEALRMLGEPEKAESTRDRIRSLFPEFWKLQLPVEEGP